MTRRDREIGLNPLQYMINARSLIMHSLFVHVGSCLFRDRTSFLGFSFFESLPPSSLPSFLPSSFLFNPNPSPPVYRPHYCLELKDAPTGPFKNAKEAIRNRANNIIIADSDRPCLIVLLEQMWSLSADPHVEP